MATETNITPVILIPKKWGGAENRIAAVRFYISFLLFYNQTSGKMLARLD